LNLTNPVGLWALLGIPAVLLIHFLQRKAIVLPVSTLFLLEKTQRESATGRRFDRLMNSVPLWMQLLAVIGLAWILAEPRFQRPQSVQRIAVVLDSSASMSVFKDELLEELAAALPDLQGPAARVELSFFDHRGRRLHAGDSTEEALAALAEWQPRGGLEDPTRALQVARSLAGPEGAVVFATDTPRESLPFDAAQLAVGETIDNVGIAGIRVEPLGEGARWRAVLRNYADAPSERRWQLELPDGSRTRPEPVTLDPGALVSISGELPASRARLVLDGDRFALDDAAPMLVPEPKRLDLFAATSPAFAELADSMIRSLEALAPTNDAASADLALVSYDPLDPALPEGHAVVFVDDATRVGAYLKGGIVAEKHPLVDDLNWQSLLVRETIQLERLPEDDVLLWQGRRPLIFLREIPDPAGGPPFEQLCFNFDLRRSNATTEPAFIVSLHRFVESIRRRKVAPTAANLETGQRIELAARADGPPVVVETLQPAGEPTRFLELEPAARIRFEAPTEPGLLRVRQGEETLLDAALLFADTREADFSACGREETLALASPGAVDRHTHEDPWWRLWVLAVLAALLVSWYFAKEKPVATPQPTP